ncbi:TonB-dependent receptor [Permianibacter sp. IMCC34836]|nr:TonB-dependent receptor [Permianibacter fluminis]
MIFTQTPLAIALAIALGSGVVAPVFAADAEPAEAAASAAQTPVAAEPAAVESATTTNTPEQGEAAAATAEPVAANGVSSNEVSTNKNQTSEDAPQIVEVRGIVGSMMRSMQLKRDENGVVDAISAEDLGKFPDTNLAEALQRISGVTISRSNGEGSQITVRGFGPEFNLVTLNGRQMPGTGFTRSYNLEDLSAEGVARLELYKTARADKPSGGLGATVNIVTARPLEKPGQHMSFSAKGINDTSNVQGDDITPEFAGIYSNTFAEDRFGIGVSFSHQERDFRREEANIQGWVLQTNDQLPDLDPSQVIDNRTRITNAAFFPKDMNFSISDIERERTNGQLTLQFVPHEDVITTLDYTTTDATTGVNTFGWGIWNNFGNNINAYELDANGTAVYADISGDDGSFTASRSTTGVEARSLGFNVDWQINEDWQLRLDYHDSSNAVDNGEDDGLGSAGQVILGSNLLGSKIYDFRRGDIPHYYVNWDNGGYELLPSEMDSNFSQFIRSPGESDIQQLQIDATWQNGDADSPLLNLKFGAARTEQELSGYTAWSGLRGGPGFSPSFTQIFPDSMFIRHSTGGMLDAFSGGGSALQPGYYYTFDFDEAIARQLAYLTEEVMGDNQYSIDPFFSGAPSVSRVEENTDSIYLQSAWSFDWSDHVINMNVGVRYEETTVPSTAMVRVPTQVIWVAASEWITEYEPELQQQDFTGKYDVLLPMLDLKTELSDDLVARFSWGKTITRAPIGLLQGGRSFSGSPKLGSRTVSEGNTSLLPYESTNLDLSLEYYYGDRSYAAIGLFQKKVKNYVDYQPVNQTYGGLHDVYQSDRWNTAVAALEADGVQATDTAIFNWLIDNGFGNANGEIEPLDTDPLIVWRVTKPLNLNDEKTVEGVEVAVQHVFGETGFGLGFNATMVDGDVEYDPYDLEPQNPLVGISDSANLQGFYEREDLSVKLTYAYRTDYVAGMGQSQGSSDNPATQVASYGQWDVSISYDFYDHFTAFFEGININNETERGYGRFEEQFLFARQYGPRYILGVRYTY